MDGLTQIILIAGEGYHLETSLLKNLRELLNQHDYHLCDALSKGEGQVLDLTVEGLLPTNLHSLISPYLKNHPIDCLIVPSQHRVKKFLIADMESTMIQEEMLDELADQLGLKAHVAAITARAMNGELDFRTALKERVSLLKGMSLREVAALTAQITLMPGARQLMQALHQAKIPSWLVSGGFTLYAEFVSEKLSFDQYFANELVVEDGLLCGEVKEPILDKEEKRRLLKEGCDAYALHLSETLAIGDGANDLPMLLACHEGGGLAIAYRAKPAVKALIPNQINFTDHRALLFAQGLL